MEYKKDCYESGKMMTKVGIDYLNALKKRHYIYQTIYQDETGMISEEKAKTYPTWEIFYYDFGETDKQVVVCAY
jgi:hypothetical protein